MTPSPPALSIVTTLFHSEAYVRAFYDRICAAAALVATDFEVVFVNDGSPDNSLELAVALLQEDERVKVVDLSRNFGQHRALMTGLAHSRGELVFQVDCDLEVDPAVLKDFHRRLRSTGADVVYGIQDSRRDRFLPRLAGEIFYLLLNALSTHSVPRNLTTVRLMTRRYVDALISHREREVALAGLWTITGFQQVPIDVRKYFKGTTTYSFRRKLDLAFNAITSFSNRPLVLIFYLGSIISLVSCAAALMILIRRLAFGVLLEGWPTLIISVWFLGGLTLLSLGVIGIYLAKMFTEVKQRPYAIVRDVFTRDR